MGAIGGTEILIIFIIYMLPFIFMIWMIFRFVKAHEKIADGINRIEKKLKNKNNLP